LKIKPRGQEKEDGGEKGKQGSRLTTVGLDLSIRKKLVPDLIIDKWDPMSLTQHFSVRWETNRGEKESRDVFLRLARDCAPTGEKVRSCFKAKVRRGWHEAGRAEGNEAN